MKTHKIMTQEEIRTKGLEVLSENLGPAGMIKFLQMFDKGSGDYTKERRQWQKETDINKIVKEIISERETE